MANDQTADEGTRGPNTLVVFDGNSDMIMKFKVEDDKWISAPNVSYKFIFRTPEASHCFVYSLAWQGFTKDMNSWSFTAATVGRALLVFMSNKAAYRFQRSKSGKSCWMRLPDTIFNHGERPPAVAHKDNIYIVGSGGVGAPTNKVEKYSLPKDKWIPLPPLAVPRRNHAAVSADVAIYAIGGITNRGVSASIDKLCMSTRTWENVASLNEPRHSAAAVTSADDIFILAWIVDGKIYAVGGDNRQHDSVEVYDAAGDRWDMMDILSTLHVDAAVCMLIP